MNERLELENLKKRQHYLETQFEGLGRDIQRLEKRLEAEQNSVCVPASVEPPLQPANCTNQAPSESVIMPASPPPIPPALKVASIDLQTSAEAAAAELAASPPVIPPSLTVPIAEVEAAMAVEAATSPEKILPPKARLKCGWAPIGSCASAL
ncbi:MAG TPA: hypothetical protein VFA77_14995 [Candidatus Eisenbacteria bacterium]|jgi:hypothetical protein|nr:hypothetical protein [Candidatus Eisenbacteria bacterium]